MPSGDRKKNAWSGEGKRDGEKRKEGKAGRCWKLVQKSDSSSSSSSERSEGRVGLTGASAAIHIHKKRGKREEGNIEFLIVSGRSEGGKERAVRLLPARFSASWLQLAIRRGKGGGKERYILHFTKQSWKGPPAFVPFSSILQIFIARSQEIPFTDGDFCEEAGSLGEEKENRTLLMMKMTTFGQIS